MKNYVIGAVAGMIVFVWVMLSWMALPFHKNSVQSFNNETVIVKAILANTPKPGMYVHPGMDATPEEMKGSHVLTVVKGPKDMTICMISGLLIQILAGLLMVCMIKDLGINDFGKRMKMIIKVSIFAGLVGVAPNWTWWGFSVSYTLLGMADLLVGWALAGVLIAKFVTPKTV